MNSLRELLEGVLSYSRNLPDGSEQVYYSRLSRDESRKLQELGIVTGEGIRVRKGEFYGREGDWQRITVYPVDLQKAGQRLEMVEEIAQGSKAQTAPPSMEYSTAFSSLHEVDTVLSQEEREFLARLQGKLTWYDIIEQALEVYDAVIGEAGKQEFRYTFLPRVKMLYPNNAEAGIVITHHLHEASWLQSPNSPADYFANLSIETESRGFRLRK